MPDGRALASLCDGPMNSTRIRKTVVRLAALALVGANQILVDILGHRDPDQTLGYILSDPDMQDEIRTVAREASIVLGKEAIMGVESNGGPAAHSVRELAQRTAPRGAPSELEAFNLTRAAEILSSMAPSCSCARTYYVRRAITSMDRAHEEPARPTPVTASLIVGTAWNLTPPARTGGPPLCRFSMNIPSEACAMRSWWQAQLVAHLTPFADLRAEALADPLVVAALFGVNEKVLAELGLRQLDPDAR